VAQVGTSDHNADVNLPDLSAVVVAHDSGPDLQACVESIRREARAAGLHTEVIVVDNASQDGAVAGLDGVRVVANATNRGYGAAANQGFRAGRADRVLFLNPDATLEPGSLSALMLAVEDAALAAPRLELHDGSAQESPRAFYDVESVLARRTPYGRTASGRRAAERHLPTSQERGDVDWVTGAAMLLRRDAVGAAGPFDERYFLYFEDVDLCRRLRATGHRVVFEPAATVRHRFGAGSRRQVPWNPLLWHHVVSGLRYAGRWSEGLWETRWWRTAVESLSVALLQGVAFGLITGSPWLAAAGALLAPPPRRRLGRRPLPSPIAQLLVLGLAAALTLPSPASVLVAATVGTLSLQVAHRLLRAVRLRWLRGRGHRANVLIAGEPDRADHAERSLRENVDEGLVSVGFVPLDAAAEGGPSPRLPDWSRVADAAADLRADGVLLAASPSSLARMAGGVASLRERGIECAWVLTEHDELAQSDAPDLLGGLPLVRLGDNSRVAGVGVRIVERLLAVIGLVLLAPIAPLLLLFARFASGTSPIQRLDRVGVDLAPFGMWRLRSGPDGEGDAGGGRLGALLRRWHVDELPQLLNVVGGDMRLVGPRPVHPDLVDRLTRHEQARFSVPPGITGMWQLDRLRRWRLDQMIRSDLLYVLRWTPRLDGRILVETLLGRRNP
jgi:N-acetylglucosaminyl-diphospho-decaprenol L-rhamnosyltransferase